MTIKVYSFNKIRVRFVQLSMKAEGNPRSTFAGKIPELCVVCQSSAECCGIKTYHYPALLLCVNTVISSLNN